MPTRVQRLIKTSKTQQRILCKIQKEVAAAGHLNLEHLGKRKIEKKQRLRDLERLMEIKVRQQEEARRLAGAIRHKQKEKKVMSR